MATNMIGPFWKDVIVSMGMSMQQKGMHKGGACKQMQFFCTCCPCDLLCSPSKHGTMHEMVWQAYGLELEMLLPQHHGCVLKGNDECRHYTHQRISV